MSGTTTDSIRSSRLAVRMTPEQRSTINKAAELKGMSITQWVLDHLMNDAKRDIGEETTIRLSSPAFDDFKDALDKPMPRELIDLLSRETQWL